MPHQIGYVESGGGKLAHQNMLVAIADLAGDAGWDVLRYDDSGVNHELILRGPGLSGTEEIYGGFRCYQDASNDYYNLVAAGFTGYVASNTFDTQPGVMLSGVPAHNTRIDYWLTVNGQRIVLAAKVGTPVYQSCYVGKCLPYATPGQYPYPLVVGGMLAGTPATRFSNADYGMPFIGSRSSFRLRWLDGTWAQPACWPWSEAGLTVDGPSTGQGQVRDTAGTYALLPVVMHGAQGVLGELDGVAYVSGFNNAVENTTAIDGKTWVVIQDVWRTAFSSYFAMRLDT